MIDRINYKLMIKTHTNTGLKYLCVTTKFNHAKYLGSGLYWRRHLHKHGRLFETELIFESTDLMLFNQTCSDKSLEYDVVNSNNFANLIPELGYNVKGGSMLRLQDCYTEDQLRLIYDKRNISIRNNHWSKNDDKRSEICSRISKSHKSRTITQKQLDQLSVARYKAQIHITEIYADPELSIQHRKKLSDARKLSLSRETEDQNLARNANISQSRKSMSDDAKASRKQKILQGRIYNDEFWDNHASKLSIERIGKGNPNAKGCIYQGIVFDTKRDLHEYCKLNSLSIRSTLKIIDMALDENNKWVNPKPPKCRNTVICPKCNKIGLDNSTFKRWHFANCKQFIKGAIIDTIH